MKKHAIHIVFYSRLTTYHIGPTFFASCPWGDQTKESSEDHSIVCQSCFRIGWALNFLVYQKSIFLL